LKRLIKTTLISVAILTGLAGLALLAINLYIQSPGTQARLQKSVSEAIGYPIDFFRISFSPWGGFHFENVVIQNTRSDVPLLKARDLRIHCEYLPLFRQKVIIRQVVLTAPEIRIPVVERSGSNPAVSSQKQAESPLPEANRENSNASPVSPATPPAPPSPFLTKPAKRTPGTFWVQIRKFKIRDGSIYLLGPNSVPIATLRTVEGNLEYHKDDYLGKISIASATLYDLISLEEISSPVKISNGVVQLDNIEAALSDGSIHGAFHLDLLDPVLPYRLEVALNGINVNKIINRTGGIFERAHGSLEGTFKMTGTGNDPSQAQGNGILSVKAGYLDQYPVMQEIGRWTQIDELRKLELDRASAHFCIIGPDIKIDDLALISKNCQINLSGLLESAQKLNLNGRLTVSQFLSQKIPNELEDNFVTVPESQSRYLDFKINGSVTKPQTDFFDRLIGDKSRLLKRVLRSDRREKRQDKNQE
jgi:uncharacterized protein involved in outer membrane biogenesis